MPSHSQLTMLSNSITISILAFSAAAFLGGIAHREPPKASAPTAVSPKMDEPTKPDHPKGIAVVELFTSEGCSSCPAADSALSEIVAQSKKDGTPVYSLAFHVDYWNYLGWTDRFSTSAATNRQRQYAKAFKISGMYTPQMVINGSFGTNGVGVQNEFVGSDRDKAKHDIAAAIKTPATEIKLTVYPHKVGERIVAEVSSETLDRERTEVLFAIVENGLSTQVKKGENAGRTLKHDAVVRNFEVVHFSGKEPAKASLTLPKDAVEANLEIIAVVQESKTMRVLAAARGEPASSK